MKYFSTIIVFTLAFFTLNPLTANIDSLKLELLNTDAENRIETLLKLAKELSYGNEKESIGYSNQALQLAQNEDDDASAILALTYIGDAYYYAYKLEEALDFYEKALKASNAIDNHGLMGDAYNNIGTVHYLWGEYKIAKKNLHEAVKHYDIAEDNEGLANCYNNLGSIELDQGKVNEANLFYQQTLKFKVINYLLNLHNGVHRTNIKQISRVTQKSLIGVIVCIATGSCLNT